MTPAAGRARVGSAAVAAPAHDVITMGRIGVDIYPQSDGPLEGVTAFSRSLGGTATNVAVAAARLGRRTAVITKVGDDPFGRYAVAALVGFGVDTRFVSATPDLPTPVVFAELDPPEEPRIWFYRYPKAPDMMLASADLDPDAIRAAAIFWATGTGLSDEPSLATTMEALALRDPAATTVLDLDWRPMLWPDPAPARDRYRAALRHVSVVVGNRSEVAVAVGELEPDEAAEALLALGPRLAVVKLGGEGVLVATRGRERGRPADPGGGRERPRRGRRLRRRALPSPAGRRRPCGRGAVCECGRSARRRPARVRRRDADRGRGARAPGGRRCPLTRPASTSAPRPTAADPLVLTPEACGWQFAGLRVARLAAGERRPFETGGDELAVIPLAGGCAVEVEGRRISLEGRTSVFDRVTDVVYLPSGTEARHRGRRGV